MLSHASWEEQQIKPIYLALTNYNIIDLEIELHDKHRLPAAESEEIPKRISVIDAVGVTTRAEHWDEFLAISE